MVLRAISFENPGLFPVTIHAQRTGTREVSETPKTRSSQVGHAVMADERAAESSRRRMLSMRKIDGPRRSFANSRLRHSSSSFPSVIAGVSHCDRNLFSGDASELYRYWKGGAGRV